jgi:hypothetical protein
MPPLKKSVSRRQFARAAVAAAAAPLALTAAADGEQGAKVPKPILDVAEAQFQIIQGRFGKFLTQEQLKEVAQEVIQNQYSAEALKRVKLRNSDEPTFAFRADLP